METKIIGTPWRVSGQQVFEKCLFVFIGAYMDGRWPTTTTLFPHSHENASTKVDSKAQKAFWICRKWYNPVYTHLCLCVYGMGGGWQDSWMGHQFFVSSLFFILFWPQCENLLIYTLGQWLATIIDTAIIMWIHEGACENVCQSGSP